MEQQTRTPVGRPAVGRRTVARTAAWAVPVITTAVGAPAFASSGSCQQRGAGTIGTGTVGYGGNSYSQLATSLMFPGGVSASLSYAKTGTKQNLDPFRTDGQGNPQTGSVDRAQYGGGWSYVVLSHPEGMRQNDTLTMTIAFSQAVENLSLTITQIDTNIGYYEDEVMVWPTDFSVSSRGAAVSGDGITRPFEGADEAAIGSPDNDVTLQWAGSHQTFWIDLVVGDRTNASLCGQWVGVGNFSYDSC